VGDCLFVPRYHAVLAVKVCGALRLAACGRLRTLTAALRRGASDSGQSARPPESIMSQFSIVSAAQLFVEEFEGSYRQALPAEILAAALSVVERRVQRGFELTAPSAAREYLAVRLGSLEHEVFAVVFLDAQNRVIEYQEMFRGTVTQTAVYPREVVKAALALNAVATILVHNHPSGHAEPSRADEFLTQTLKAALAMVDVRVLDHLVIAGSGIVSFAERGLL
jgi:DNA repair protein RadC